MTYTPLDTDFKDDILASQNNKRKYTTVNNSDGTVSFQDSTAYSQIGSTYGAKEINEEREAINNIRADKLVSLDEIELVTEEGYYVDALALKETNKGLIDRLDKDYQLAYGTWYASGTVIPLNDSYLNYRDIIIRTGWNSQNGGLRDNRISINGNGTTIHQVIPIYQATKYIGALVVEFNPDSPKQIKIVQSSGLTSNNASNGIRNVMGRSKIS